MDKKAIPRFCDFLSAGKDLLALREKQQAKDKKDEEEEIILDMDLLYGQPDRKSNPYKKKGKANSKAAPKSKKGKSDGFKVVLETVPVLNQSSDDDDDEIQAKILLERAKRKKRNINRYRKLATEQTTQLDVELANYLAAHSSSSCSNTEVEETCVQVDNTETPIIIFVRWKFGMDQDRYVLKKYQTFESIFRVYADKESVPIEKIHMEIASGEEERQIKHWFTPDDVNMAGVVLLEGCLMNIDTKKNESDDEDLVDDDKIELKMQLKGRRDRLTVRMGPKETFKLAMLKLADQISQPVEKLRFHFDGEVVQTTQTPEDLELEGGEMFDVEII